MEKSSKKLRLQNLGEVDKNLAKKKQGHVDSEEKDSKVAKGPSISSKTKNGPSNIKSAKEKKTRPESEVHISKEQGSSTDSASKSGGKAAKKKNPYTVFVGNISYRATDEEIKKHFGKAGEVADVRVPTDKESGKRKGFAYVEFKDRSSYEKALGLHHSKIHGRPINVEYTTQGKKGGPKEEKIKQKNLKLRALSKLGILPLISGNKKKQKAKSEPESMSGTEDSEKSVIKMAISSIAKRARNTSESDEKVSKKKKHSAVASEAVSSKKSTPNKKGVVGKPQKNETPSKQEKSAKNAVVNSGKKGMAKSTPKTPSSKKVPAAKSAKATAAKKGKASKKKAEDDEDDSDEEEESGDEESDEEEGNDGPMEVEEEEESGDEDDEEEEEEAGAAVKEAADEAESDENEEAEGGGAVEEGSDEEAGAGGNDEEEENESGSEEEDNESEGDEDDSDDDEGPPKKSGRRQDQNEKNDQSDDFTAFVSNIPYSISQEELETFFNTAGTVKSVRMPVDNKSGRPRGFVFVSFEDEDGLKAALDQDGVELKGRVLKIVKSHNRGSGGGGDRGGRGFRGGFRGFRGGGDRGGRGFRGGGDRGSRGFRGGGDRGGSRGGFRGGDRDKGGRGGGFGRGGSRGFGGGDRNRAGGGGRQFSRGGGGGRQWQNKDRSGGDSD